MAPYNEYATKGRGMNFDEMMAELRTEYLATFPQKFLEIETHLSAVDFSRLRDDFHKLKGTGKTYGIPEISELCAIIEKICLNAASTTTAPGNSMSTASASVRLALSILRKIVASRQAGRELNLATVEEFANLRPFI